VVNEASPVIEDLPDRDVNEEDDRRLRQLLSYCFTKAEDHVFAQRRYFQEAPDHRFLMRTADGEIAAHVALHDKMIGSKEGELHIGGVAEVCTHPDHRGRGHIKALLAAGHAWMTERNMVFSMLFGEPYIYTSSGYVHVENPIRLWDWKREQWVTEAVRAAMVRPLTDLVWPEGVIDLRGPMF
jgi:predicted acetyltransferase